MVADVVVAGGGPIGLAVAWRCAQRGMSVTLVDQTEAAPTAGAWYAAGGMLAPVTEAGYGEERLLALGRASLERFPDFVSELERCGGRPVGLRSAGTLSVGFDADDMGVLDELLAFQTGLGLDARRLTPSEARAQVPMLTPRVRGAVYAPGDLSVDSRTLHAGLRAAARSAGVRLVAARAEALLVTGGRATGVRLDDGSESLAAHVVLALGAWSASLPGVPPGLPVRPVKGQILRLRGAHGLLDGTVRALVRGRPVYLVSYPDGGLAVGATVEDKGFDAVVTAGATHDLLHDAIDVVPAVSELELVETLARWRPGTPDNAPLLGPWGPPGLVLATGHYRNGVLLTPVTGDLIAELLVTGTLPALGGPFTADRFGR
jgi:glycine oxidase